MTEPEYVEKVQRYKNMIYRLAFNYMKSRSDAEDISQEVFIKLLKADKVFPSDEDEKAWLIRVTINASKDMLRSAWFRKTVPIDENIPASETEEAGLLYALMQISPKYRTVIYLHYYEDYPIKEISKILNVKESAVLMRLFRARRKLQEILEKDYDFKKEGIYESGN